MINSTNVHESAEVIFRGVYYSRSRHGVFSCLVASVCGIPAVLLSVSYAVAVRGNWYELMISIAIAIAGSISAVVGASKLIKIIRNYQHPVEITKDGIRNGSRFRNWAEIDCFEGLLYGGKVVLSIRLAREVAWFGEDTLRTTPWLSKERYLEIVQELQRKVQPAFPNLKIAPSPVQGD